MPPLANYHIDGVALTNPEHGWLLTADTQLDLPLEPDMQDVSLPGSHGVVGGLPAPYGAPVLELVHDIEASSQAQLRDRHRALVGLLRDGSRLRRVEAGVGPVEARVELVSVSTPGRFVAGRSLQITSQFRLPDVFWRDAGYAMDEWAFSSLLDDHEVTHLRGSTAPVSDAVVRVTGPLSSLVLVDNASKTSVRWGGSLSADGYLFIDCASYTAWRSGSAGNWNNDPSMSTDRSGGLDYTQTGMLKLTPRPHNGDPMDRRVIIDANGSGRDGSSTKLAIRSRRSFL